MYPLAFCGPPSCREYECRFVKSFRFVEPGGGGVNYPRRGRHGNLEVYIGQEVLRICGKADLETGSTYRQICKGCSQFV